ncbi:hypothetical protein ACWCP6_25015 [Streptomyces sp. NPDC002004]
MASATTPTAFPRFSVGDGSRPGAVEVSRGGWSFTPGSASTPEAGGSLHCDGAHVELRYCSADFAEFLAEMIDIQAEFDRHSTPVAAGHGEWGGRNRHV